MAKKFYPPVPTAPVPAIRDTAKKARKGAKIMNGKFLKGTKSLVKKGIKFGLKTSAVGLGLSGAMYLAGGKSRRYVKAPKFGEGRDLTNKIIGYGKD
jgi:hypothetical protein|tara:strand:+ start:168 stop:458 length:291 start_codon:yes stop_codon:yes gene_type:complete